MTESLMLLTAHLLGDQIGPFAKLFHALVLAVVAIAWVFPPISTYLRERERVKGTYWVPMWHCRQCGHFNPPDFVECKMCRNPMRPPWWEKILPAFAVDILHHSANFFLGVYRIMGWVLFYCSTLFVFWNMKLYDFGQYPLQELMGSIALLLLLLTLSFLGRVFTAKLESPAARLTDFAAGTTFCAFFFLAGFLWAAASFPPEKPLGHVQLLGEGRVRLMSSSGNQTLASAVSEPDGARFSVQVATLRWPLFYMDQTFVTRLGGEPVMDPGTLLILDAAARFYARHDPERLLVLLRDQSFQVAAGKTYSLVRSAEGVKLEEKG